jgi:hypothetical protein
MPNTMMERPEMYEGYKIKSTCEQHHYHNQAEKAAPLRGQFFSP